MRALVKTVVLLSILALAACAHESPPAPAPGVLRAFGILSRDERALITVTLFDQVYYGRYAIAPQRHAIPDHFGGTRSLVRSDLEFGGQGNGRATLADKVGAPLYCVFDVEPLTFEGNGECQDREGRLYDLTVAAD